MIIQQGNIRGSMAHSRLAAYRTTTSKSRFSGTDSLPPPSSKAIGFNSGMLVKRRLPDATGPPLLVCCLYNNGPKSHMEKRSIQRRRGRGLKTGIERDDGVKETKFKGTGDAAREGERRLGHDGWDTKTPTVAIPHEPQLPRSPLGNKRGRGRTLMTQSALLFFIYTFGVKESNKCNKLDIFQHYTRQLKS